MFGIVYSCPHAMFKHQYFTIDSNSSPQMNAQKTSEKSVYSENRTVKSFLIVNDNCSFLSNSTNYFKHVYIVYLKKIDIHKLTGWCSFGFYLRRHSIHEMSIISARVTLIWCMKSFHDNDILMLKKHSVALNIITASCVRTRHFP